MSAKNEARQRVAHVLLMSSVLLFALGFFADSGWSFFLVLLGSTLLLVGGVMFTSLSIIKGVPWITRLMSRWAEPVWEGEILHTDGGRHKVRYLFDERGRARFVASDVCDAIGTKSPLKDALRYGGVPLLVYGGHACFSESDIQEFLLPLSTKNHDANRLLILIRNNVLRKLGKQREAEKLYG